MQRAAGALVARHIARVIRFTPFSNPRFAASLTLRCRGKRALHPARQYTWALNTRSRAYGIQASTQAYAVKPPPVLHSMGKRSKLRKEGDDALVYEQLKEDVSAAVDAAPAAAVPETPQPKVAKKQRRSIKEAPSSPPAALAAAKPEENGAQNLDEEVEEVVEVKKRRKRSHKKIKQAAGPQESSPATEAQLAMIVEEVEETLEEVQEEIVVKKSRRRAPDPLPCTDPTHELLASLEDYIPPPRPVPNLGYACLCMDLRELKPPVFTSRDCIKRTFDAKGLPYIGELCLANCRDLARVIQWNHEHGIRFFRMSSVLWPWMGTFSFHDLPQKEEIAAALRFAGDLARKYDQRVTFHPSHFVKLASPDEDLTLKSIAELEAHSLILDLMGFDPSPINKINIHVGGVYATLGSKEETMERWAANFKRLSPSCRARMTVENDDVASAFSLEDLLTLNTLCGVPLVFDFHHHKFCPGGLTQEEAFKAAIKTWPEGVRPVVHWSESQAGRKPHAHSDYVKGPIFLHGLEADVDVMIESKCKERALLAYRDGLPIPEVVVGEEPPLAEDEEVALNLL